MILSEIVFRRVPAQAGKPGYSRRKKERSRHMVKILLVEDNEMIRDMLSRRLQRQGYQIIGAADGAQGVKMAQSEMPDIILLDLSLPILDGWEMTRRIRALPETSSIPIIVLTAHTMPGIQKQCLEAGCDEYDTKPVDFPRLLTKIEELLRKEAA